jgi:hypothetical protein
MYSISSRVQTVDTEWSSSLGIVQGANNPSPGGGEACYGMLKRASVVARFFGKT